MQEKLLGEYHHSGANKNFRDINNKRDKNPETFRMVEKRQEITKPGNIRFRFDSNVNQKVWVPQKTRQQTKRPDGSN